MDLLTKYRTAATGSAARFFRLKEQAVRSVFFCTALFAVVVISFILLFLLRDGYSIFETVGIPAFLFGMSWTPTAMEPAYGIFPLIVGTIFVTFGAMVFAVPLSLGCAIYISEIASPRVKSILKPATELLAGIPSVVYGFFGLIVLTTLIREIFNLPTGETWLAGSILLGIMALPTIISVSEDAISSVPHEFREGSLAVGATKWETISRVIVPAALSGIAAAIILGIGRAIGETMAVLMVTGNAAILPDPIWNVLSPIRTLTGTLGIEMGEVSIGSDHYHALFGVAVVLLIITLIVNLSAVRILNYLNEGRTAPKASKKSLLSPRAADKLRTILTYVLAVAGVIILCVIAPLWIALPLIAAALLWYFYGRQRITRYQSEKIAFGLLVTASVIVIAILVFILQDIVINGLPALSWEFLTQPPSDLGRAGGIFPAIIGTLYLVCGAILKIGRAHV